MDQLLRGGNQHREKAGTRQSALDLYKIRKANVLRNRKLPELRPGNVVTFGELLDDVSEFAQKKLGTPEDYICKAETLREPFGTRAASELNQKELDSWIDQHCKTAATANRYRAFLSTTFREGMKNDKVTSNPARLITARKEDNARTRFLTRQEFESALSIVKRDNPTQAPSLVVAAYSAMRWSEQFSLTWSQVDFRRKLITNVPTKNRKAKTVRRRDVPLNSVSIAALQDQKRIDGKAIGPKAIVFPRPGPYADWDWWLKPALKEAGIEEVVWHSLRHTCLSWAAMSGATMKEVQELGGHLTITQAARYMHLSPSHTSGASERMAQWQPNDH